MAIRVGVDVGGTFTKAIAFDTEAGGVVSEAILPTTHSHANGVAAGVVDVVAAVTAEVGADRVEMVTHSTTQAVNALLEGDVTTVGMIGMARSTDLRKAKRRTTEARIELSEGRVLPTVSEMIDVTDGVSAEAAEAVIERLRAKGARAIAVAEAFAPDDLTNETAVANAARAAGLPVTTSAELTGLYGLELRAVTAALNASILPIALRTAEVVAQGVRAAGVSGEVMVMRGDGGATDLAGFRTAPARTLYSGPAASVAGALRSGRIDDAVILEVGGTSTNVAAIRRGRPALSYVQVASHATAIRALDVRVLGVAGGSMLRARRGQVYGVGPRSAHIADLPYACFVAPGDLDGAEVELIAPREGDPADYLVLRDAGGHRIALTNTCAANALGIVEDGDYARGDTDAALLAFDLAGRHLGLEGREVARRVLAASTQAVGDLVTQVIHDHKLQDPGIVAVGGGAGALGRSVATGMGLSVTVPEKAEVISAIGDALSLIRAERERTFASPTPAAIEQLIEEVEAEAVGAGAAAASLDIRVDHLAERGAVRVTATGAVGLQSGAVPGRSPMTDAAIQAVAQARGYPTVEGAGSFWIAAKAGRKPRVAVFDQYGDLVVDIGGERFDTDGPVDLDAVLDRQTRRIGVMSVAPDVWILSGNRFVQVPDPDAATVLAAAASLGMATDPTTILVGRE